MQLLNLPPEIINSILSHLSPQDLFSCQLTSKFLNISILNSVGIQYNRALTLASAADSPFSTRPTAEKLKSLQGIEDAWTKMRTDFVLRSDVPLRESGVYDLTGGVYLLSTPDRTGLGYMHLPSKEGEKGSWKMIQIGKFVVDVGLCVYEHDLIAVITSAVRITPAGEPNTFDIEIELLELSTQKPHPLAHNSTIHVLNSLWERPSVGIEIVGKHLVLVLSFNAREHPEDRVFVYEWQTGATIASFEARCHTYGSILFLDEDHFLLPNTRTNTLDIFRIPSAPTLARLEPILQLALPLLIDNRVLGSLSCRAEPNPIGKDSYANMRARCRQPHSGSGTALEGVDGGETPLNLLPKRDFLLESSTALCMFELRIHVLIFHIVPGGGLQMGFPYRYSFTFVAHRSAFLDLIAKHAIQRKHADAPLADRILETTADAHRPVREQRQGSPSFPGSASVDRLPPAVTPLSDIFSTIEAVKTPGTKAPRPSDPLKLAYDDWGPACTRWFGSNEFDVSVRWITTSAGGRCVRMPAPLRMSEGERFYVYDFNWQSVEAAKEWVRKNKEKVGVGRAKVDRRDGKGHGKGKSLVEAGSGESDGDGDDNDEGDDGAPRRDKGKGKARVDNPATWMEDTQLGAEERRPHPVGPKKRLAAKVSRTRTGLITSDDEGPSDESGVDTDAFRIGRNHDWTVTLTYDDGTTEQHRFGGPNDEDDHQELDGLANADAQQVDPEALEQFTSDHTMDMFLQHVDAMEEFDDVEHEDDDPASEDEERDQDNQAPIFGLDQDDEDADTETHETHELGIFDTESKSGSDDDPTEPLDFGLPNAEEIEAFADADREGWTIDSLPLGSSPLVLDEDSMLDCPEVFQNPVRHSLPCIIRSSEQRHQWNGVLLDEERVIGILADPMTGHVQEIEIHHFG